MENKEDSDRSSDSSDNTSIYNVGTVNGRATDVEHRPVRTVKIDNKDINVLIDTGVTPNIMDEEAYRKIYPGQQKLKKAKSIMQPYRTHR
jgi:translation elongation factor P/translation initiation factor 5A